MSAPGGSPVAGRAVRATFLLAPANLLTYAASFGVTLVLARMLTPSQFGTVALATAIAEIVFLAAGWSLPIAVLREPDATAQIAFDTALLLTGAISVVVIGVAALGALLIDAVASRALALVFFVVVAGRLVGLVGGCYQATLERQFAYKRVAAIQAGSVALALVVALVLAGLGAGVWALAARDVAVGVGTLVLGVMLSSWRFRRSAERRKARELLAFGAQMLGSRLGDMLFHRYDNLLVGAISGTRELGLYNQAYVLTETGNKVYGPILQQVPLSAYARFQDRPDLTRRTFSLVTFFLSRAVVPPAVLFLVLPGETLTFLLGEPWRGAENMLRALAAYALLQPLFDHMRVLLVANGAVRRVLAARAVQIGFFLPAAALGTVFWDGNGAAVAVAGGLVIGTAALAVACRGLAVFRAKDLAPPVIAGVCAAVAAAAVPASLGGARLLFGSLALLGTYCLGLVVLEHRRLGRELGLVVRLLRTSSVPRSAESLL